MNPDIFAEWFRRQGQLVIRTASSYWVKQGPGAFQAFPFHWIIEPTQSEINDLLKKYRAITLRYSTPIHVGAGYVSYHAILEDPAYGYPNLSRGTRTNVRKGLKSCQVERISFECLAQEGFFLQLDTLNRQGRQLDLEHDKWKTLCLAAGDLPGFEAWGSLVDGKLAASAIVFQMDNCYYILYQQSLRQYLSEKVNNALTFSMTQNLMKRAGTRSIFYGLHSLDAPVSVDEFKFHMGYMAKPVRQRVDFHPWFKPFATRTTHKFLTHLCQRDHGNPFLAKAEGMLRFYLEGKRSLEEQNTQKVLRPARESYSIPSWDEASSNMNR